MISNQSILSRRDRTYYQQFRDSAYRVGCVGKLDLSKSSGTPGLDGKHPRTFAWGFTHPMEIEGKWNAGSRQEAFGPYTKYLSDRNLLADFANDYAHRRGVSFPQASYPSVLPDEAFADTYIANHSAEWVREIPDDLPWHLFVSFVGPHDPFDPPARFLQRYEGASMPEPVNPSPDNAGRPRWISEFSHFRPESSEDITKARRHYCAATEAIDEGVGTILEALEERGQAENTIIVFSSDHGESLGDHGLWEKQVAYDPSIRIPLAVCGPGISKGRVVEDLVELIDINETLCELCGIPGIEGADARSFAGQLVESARVRESVTGSPHVPEGRDHIYTSMPGFHCIRTHEWKYIDNINDIVELYDLANDPDETTNIAEQRPEEIKRFRQLLQARRTREAWKV
jgi:choline-sulfatase